ncbi:MAG: BPL-N domain-containing protein [Candidatus Thorarchaeota archaeon]
MKKARLVPIIVVVVLLLVVVPNPAKAETNNSRTDLSGVKVAVYGETNNMVVSSGIALHAMFEWMNASVDYLFGDDVKAGDLEDYDILAMPGGQMGSYFATLGNEGMDIIREWITNGGSYFGICGGALFAASEYALGIFNGSYALAIEGEYTLLQLTTMNVNTTCTGPDLSEIPESFDTLFWGSSYFIPDDGFEYIPLARYSEGGGPGMIAFEYQSGNLFLSSPHPEYEEGSMRDDTTEFDEFNDSDTEWNFLLQIAIWQVESSMTYSLDTEFPLLEISIISVVAVSLVIVFYRKLR